MRSVDPASVQYRKSIMGKTEVIYDCPRCKKNLRSPLTDAGNQDHCPHCDCEFIVPGEEEQRRAAKAKEEKRLQAEKAEKEERLRAAKAKEEKRLQAEKAKEEERLRIEKAVEEERLRVLKVNKMAHNTQSLDNPSHNKTTPKKKRNSNHYISLGLMYVMSVIANALRAGAFLAMGGFVTGLAFAAGGDEGARAVFILLSLLCYGCAMIFTIKQWYDISAAREAFRYGSNPDKTTDK